MRLNFVKMNPAGNTTIFIIDYLPRKFHQIIAGELMKHSSICAEQVGYIEKPDADSALIRLQMMGGEFCGNATRALAAYLVDTNYAGVGEGIKHGQSVKLPMEVSGYDGILEATVCKKEQLNQLWAETIIPSPRQVLLNTLKINGQELIVPIVDLPGIKHVILKGVKPAESVYWEILEQIGEPEALGIMFLDQDNHFMVPLVGVTAANSLVWESSCGSGTVATAAVLADESNKSINNLTIKQPGGEVTVDLKFEDNNFTDAKIKGPVEFVAEGHVIVSF